MSNFCQACDREMIIAGSVVDYKGYTTCGAASCKAKVDAWDAMPDQMTREETQLQSADVVLFVSKDPEDDSLWQQVPHEDWPEFMEDPVVVGRMLDGEIVSYEEALGDCYCVKRAEQVLVELQQYKDQQRGTTEATVLPFPENGGAE